MARFAQQGSMRAPTAFQLVVVVLVLGYVIIFYNVLTSPSPGTGGEDAVQAELDRVQRLVSVKNVELDRLRTELTKRVADETHTQPPTPTPPPQAVSPHVSLLHPAIRPGVVVLGMHRSGTSIVGGLLNQMGLNVGGPLIQAAEDNAKGFFERIDVVLQNDYLMKKQTVHYAWNTHKYDAHLGLKHALEGEATSWFSEGRRGLAFLNDEKNHPWMLKDPRLCITLRTWLGLLNFVPAVLFTYRHPLDVALSLHKREFEQYRIARGLKMWYVYNMRGILNSNDLCRVVASHKKVMSDPRNELDRIFDQLTECGVPVPHRLQTSQITDFIDPKLQHGRNTLKDASCGQDLSTIVPPETWPTTDLEHITLYREVIRVYCAMEDGTAFSPGFKWVTTMTDS
jgi:hypothetical protein